MDAIQKYPWGKGTIKFSVNSTLNDSDKVILTVPTGKIIEPLFISVSFKSSGTVGTRKLLIGVNDGTGYVLCAQGNVGQATGLEYVYLVTFGPANMTTVPSTYSMLYDGTITDGAGGLMSFPKMYLPATYTIRVWDSTAIDAAGDDMTTVIHYVEYDA